MSATNLPGQVIATLGAQYGTYSPFPLYFLTGFSVTAAGATFTTPAFPVYNSLVIVIGVPSFSASDSAAIRFNGDTGANYVSRFITAVAGGVVFADAPFVSGTSMRVSAIAGTTGHNIIIKCTNIATVSKQCVIQTHLTTGAAATAPTAVIAGSGEWVNTTAQITTVTLMTASANNLGIGTSLMVFGGL